MNDLVIGVIGSIVGAVICSIAVKLYTYLKFYKDSEYSGVWEDTIPAIEGISPEKHDRFTIKHNKKTNAITGTIVRTYPENQTSRKWIMNGAIDDGFFIASFWRNGPQKSNGCIYAKLTADELYEGYYLEEHNGVIDKTPILLKKKNSA